MRRMKKFPDGMERVNDPPSWEHEDRRSAGNLWLSDFVYCNTDGPLADRTDFGGLRVPPVKSTFWLKYPIAGIFNSH